MAAHHDADAIVVAPPQPLTAEQQRARLEGYITLDPTLWAAAAHGDHVRYVLRVGAGGGDGGFRIGGFIAQNLKPKPAEGLGGQLRLASTPDRTKNPTYWTVRYDDIEFLFTKCSARELSILDEIHALKEGLRTLDRNVRLLNRRLQEATGRK